jgi:hypothetical protein
MGYNTEYPSAEYSGLLDDVRVYNRALSQAEIIALQTVNSPPAANIELPVAGSLFRAGDIVSFAGTGTDAEDGVLPSQSMNWEVLFHHNGQTEPVLNLPSAAQGSFTVPTVGLETSGNIEYEVIFTVTDSGGLTDTVSRTLDPDRATITLDSVPSGELILDGIVVTPPHSVDALIGYQHQISAPNYEFGNELYTFESWSDGGLQSHVIIVPDIPTSYVATYNSDQDGDGLSDSWEIRFGLDPLDSSDATGDGDNDGLNNLQEQALGTDPTNSDTDGDGAIDGDEASAGTDPVDPNSTPKPNDSDLVGWYRFDTDNGGLIVDHSGNGNDGVCTVDTTCPAFINNDGQPAGAYDFAGNGNYIDLNNESQFDFTSNFTVALWMNASNPGATWAQLIGKGDSSWSLDRAGSTNQLQFTTWASGPDELIGQTNVADGQWHHVAIVHDGSQKMLYVDGQVDAQRSYSRLLSTNNVAVRMGFNTEFPSGQYSGLLDDIRVFKRALSQGEIQQIINEAIP